MNPHADDSTREIWNRSQSSRWMLAVGAIMAGGLIVLAVVDAAYRAVSLALLIAAAAFLVTGAIKVTVSPRGVTVASVLVPFLRRNITMDRIERATARWTRPMEIGGWGYRWKPGLWAVSLRKGDALWLELTRGTRFVITIDDAQTAAELVNRYLPPRP
ncbi:MULTISPECIES: hypothetical protein [Streptomyces violaceusniger group]|uniref:Lipoprotein n=2 Tax=Streptomyces violaceusniger group TaxID=2839105 RepID=A0ABD5JCF5_9ACTN|nr:hypothetical protein [Streptomyces violaceusniger]KUL45030.1 hypothetical protein ADL28_38875 [Streptomyces violaceusniger]MEE4586073.1 hypothetical protein [Streptomyces sp. DSM 41602]WTA81319.1 hypothetical protein OG751_16225 [Streptomyces antimycoticus]